ncbi:lysM and putative peptidoglycan-binding domain-containing protein 1-like isoform X2 [Myxocyprinus asiaticus]|uniref:lysM and putative peptidoglycan-binding domain-containing protein 1-like isoform X2 n=1 Tax=Myxocyprinus asiaticus TaxID=70543 RepID=UPI0022239994|nr:lysM and putative peptidoglycan-binding domain-containing protein 1-like isoform X2 [Myxocyprinus asiaticus]
MLPLCVFWSFKVLVTIHLHWMDLQSCDILLKKSLFVFSRRKKITHIWDGMRMEQIKRANRLYTNDSIFLKESLFIPVLTESVSFSIGVELTEEETSPAQTRTKTSDETYKSQTDSSRHEENAELSPVEYLKKIDSLISQSKQAAVKRCQEGEKQFSSMEQLYFGNLDSSKASTQQAVLGDVPITITRRTRNLRDREDEIFQL